MTKGKARAFSQDIMRGEDKNFTNQKNLTWVKGQRTNLDDTSRKNLAASPRRQADQQSNLNNAPPTPEWATGTGTENMAPGTSIFDPVLCELAYRWFCPAAGRILDPFAGGSVRGIVAAYLGYEYVGVELRPEQVEANRKQATAMDLSPVWVEGDATNVKTLANAEYDLIFSCPPYYNLEVYSDMPGELSAMTSYEDFKKVYRQIVTDCVSMLKDDRFACFVVGDVRDKQGYYHNFVSDTIAAFQDAGMRLYNEAVLVTAVGSLPIRVARAFQNNRKLGKTHQNVLVFYKGDIGRIRDMGEVEVGEIEAETEAK